MQGTEVNMLELTMYNNFNPPAGWHLRYRPYAKPSARHVPLNGSYHQAGQRAAWPEAEMARMQFRSFTSTQSYVARMLKLIRFQYFMVDPETREVHPVGSQSQVPEHCANEG